MQSECPQGSVTGFRKGLEHCVHCSKRTSCLASSCAARATGMLFSDIAPSWIIKATGAARLRDRGRSSCSGVWARAALLFFFLQRSASSRIIWQQIGHPTPPCIQGLLRAEWKDGGCRSRSFASRVGGRTEVYDVDNEAFLVLQLVRRMWDYMRAPDIRAFGGDKCRKACEV